MHIRSARSRALTVIVSACALALAAMIPGSGGAVASSKAADIESKVNALLAKMTTDEKLAQLQQMVGGGTDVQEAAKAGKVGAVFGVTDAAQVNQIQRLAMEGSRLRIPILFGYDTIHGFRTTFPIGLAEAASFDPAVATADYTVAARESAAVGIKQIFSPMVDVSHEPRWGRIAEGSGEDPYLGAVMAAAKVRAAQGRDYGAPDKVMAEVKHFAAYGGAEGGRDYNQVDISESALRNLYLPPYKAAVEAGADGVMTSFNTVGGVPATGSRQLLTEILRGEWGFRGLIDSDYTAVQELIPHGVAADGADAARVALNAGLDMEMVSTNIATTGKQLLAEHKVSMSRVNDAVRNVLRVKFKAGIFEHPFVDEAAVPGKTMRPADVAAARAAAARSMVLLKNDNGALPLSTSVSKIAVVGPLADSDDLLGPWSGIGRRGDVVTVADGIRGAVPNADVTVTPGCAITGDGFDTPVNNCPEPTEPGFEDVKDAADDADVTVVVVGEASGQSGEAASRQNIDLPGRQQALIDAVKATGKPFVVVLVNGRPLTIPAAHDASPAILEAWFGGIQTGNAVADVLFGKVNPGAKLPVTFPRYVGQVPLYYNHTRTGRPEDPNSKWTSKYADGSSSPLYPFGHGLSYTSFRLSDLSLSAGTMRPNGAVTASVTVTNTGSRAGDEVVQLYVNDPVATIAQPVKRLVGFQRVTLAPGASQTLRFRIDRDSVGFYGNDGKFVVEPGQINVYAGASSEGGLTSSFTIAPR
ncbi:MAG TPA: beta-glucosidase BglX [Streptosporangiaceae bacterium]|nr:beta-glucosidase BglX [Streptosporangiaceae bacterium]